MFFLCLKFIRIHYHTQKQWKIKINWNKDLTTTYASKNSQEAYKTAGREEEFDRSM